MKKLIKKNGELLVNREYKTFHTSEMNKKENLDSTLCFAALLLSLPALTALLLFLFEVV